MFQPHYQAFVDHHGEGRKNWEFINFISQMREHYLQSLGLDSLTSIGINPDFTRFIQENAHNRCSPEACVSHNGGFGCS